MWDEMYLLPQSSFFPLVLSFFRPACLPSVSLVLSESCVCKLPLSSRQDEMTVNRCEKKWRSTGLGIIVRPGLRFPFFLRLCFAFSLGISVVNSSLWFAVIQVWKCFTSSICLEATFQPLMSMWHFQRTYYIRYLQWWHWISWNFNPLAWFFSGFFDQILGSYYTLQRPAIVCFLVFTFEWPSNNCQRAGTIGSVWYVDVFVWHTSCVPCYRMCHLNSYGLCGYTNSQGHFVDELFQGSVSKVHINTHKHSRRVRQKAE